MIHSPITWGQHVTKYGRLFHVAHIVTCAICMHIFALENQHDVLIRDRPVKALGENLFALLQTVIPLKEPLCNTTWLLIY